MRGLALQAWALDLAQQAGGGCASKTVVLIDVQVSNCFIEEGAVRTLSELETDLKAFRYGANIQESWVPDDCNDDDAASETACRCLLRARNHAEECVTISTLLNFADCGTVDVSWGDNSWLGSSNKKTLKSREGAEVCVPKGDNSWLGSSNKKTLKSGE